MTMSAIARRLVGRPSPLVLCLAAVLLGSIATAAYADTRINGEIKDIVDQPVHGARVIVKSGGRQINEARTDTRGAFTVDIEFGQSGDLILEIEHDRLEHPPVLVKIRNFEPDRQRYLIRAVPTGITSCSGADGAVFVGNFLSPPMGGAGDLTGHVHRVLSSRVLPQLQIQQLRSHLDAQHNNLLPHFLICKEAIPRSDVEANSLAQVLGGYGMIWGAIAVSGNMFDVETSITDTSNVFGTPFIAVSRGVDLGRAQEAVISPLARAAVLLGVMAKLEAKGQCEAAIYVYNVVVQDRDTAGPQPDWQTLQTKAAVIRSRCESRIPHSGLVTRDSP
jgi:hypothetical protein